MERLSTGVRVNSAKDDAAGLAISQSMTSQIRGLNQAVRNINDGVNLLQTAEGGLGAITDMLQRMRELAVQSANGTYSGSQRAYLQKEATALQEQISKVVDTTTWNDKKLLDGSFTGQKIQVGADIGAIMEVAIGSAIPSASPTQQWAKLIGTSNVDVTNSIKTGSDGSIYVTGYTYGSLDGQVPTYGSGGDHIAFLAKYSNDGSKLWTKLLGADGADGYSITTGLDGAIYVSGDKYDGSSNAFLSKYNSDGSKVWTRTLGATGTYARAVSTGSDGAIYVSGLTNEALDGQANSGGLDTFLTKFASDGTRSWTKLSGTSNDDLAETITTGIDGSIYVSGYTSGGLDGQTNNSGTDAFITKYSSDGNKSWTKLLGTIGAGTGTIPFTVSITTGLDGAIYVAADTNSGGTSATLTKMNTNGTTAWTQTLGASGTYARSVSAGPDGAIYIAGHTNESLDGQTNAGGLHDAFLTRFTSDGVKSWTKVFGSTGDDVADAITFGTDGSIFLGGYTNGSPLAGEVTNGSTDGFLIKFSPAGFSVNIQTQSGASSAIGVIDGTLNTVNSIRSTIGGYVNRLNYAGDNATNISTNLSASRSAIQDTDYAEESANLAKSQIVQQAATAMLVQANQQPQSVLALLKNL